MPSFENALPVVPFGSRTLRRTQPNLRGTDVKVLQRIYNTMLALMNPPQGALGDDIAIDGIFGPQTEAAVRNVQSYFGLPVTGVVDGATYAVFGQLDNAYGGPAFGSRTLYDGSSGGDVVVLQNRLNAYRYAQFLQHPASGTFDSNTRTAAKQFAADNVVYRHWDIRFDGVVDGPVFDILWIEAPIGGRNLREGVNGFDTVTLQVFLQNLGFYQGRRDGYFGGHTAAAVRAFQRAAGLQVDGIVGPATFHAIGLSNPVFWTSPRLHPMGTVANLSEVEVVSSTVDPQNGDRNPYGIVVGPETFDDALTRLKHGALLVSNINNDAAVMGQGTTVELIVAGQPTTFFNGAASPIALSTSNLGATWIANFGLAPDGSRGNVQVLTPNGQLFSGGVITSSLFAGPWGMTFNFGPLFGLRPVFFSTNVLTGTVDQMSQFVPPNFGTTTVVKQIGSQLAHRGTTIDNVVGPQGMVWLPQNDALFVADGADNRIVWYPNSSTVETDQGPGATIYQGSPLNQPAGMAFNPKNGNLIVVNQGDNFLIEISLTGHVVARVQLDPTPVDPLTGAGSALFGVASEYDATGQLQIYFTNDNTNTVNLLH